MGMRMGSAEDYQRHAEECVRMAQRTQDEEGRVLWLGLAQSWVRLRELAAKKDIEWGSEKLSLEDGQLTSRWSP
jgi:hypothetical protein